MSKEINWRMAAMAWRPNEIVHNIIMVSLVLTGVTFWSFADFIKIMITIYYDYYSLCYVILFNIGFGSWFLGIILYSAIFVWLDRKLVHDYIYLSLTGLGGWYSYRMSKAALNMATKNLSIELGRGSRKVICVSLHPGTVNTDLSRPYHKNVPEGKLFSVEYSVDCLMTIINNLKAKDTGKFFVWDQSEMPF